MSILADVNVSNGMMYISNQVRQYFDANVESYERTRPPFIAEVCTTVFLICCLFLVISFPFLIYTGAFHGQNTAAWIIMLSLFGIGLVCSIIVLVLECNRSRRFDLYDTIDNI